MIRDQTVFLISDLLSNVKGIYWMDPSRTYSWLLRGINRLLSFNKIDWAKNDIKVKENYAHPSPIVIVLDHIKHVLMTQ